MTNLNDTQRILLSAGGQRDCGSVYPLPGVMDDAGERATKAIAALTKRGLLEERETDDPACVVREDGDLRFGVFVTPAGLAAIGLVDDGADTDVTGPAASDPATPAAPAAPKPERQTKVAAVVALLQREEGATLLELIAATGWLPHTTRAALTGLRKKGHAVARSKRGDATCYRIVAAG